MAIQKGNADSGATAVIGIGGWVEQTGKTLDPLIRQMVLDTFKNAGAKTADEWAALTDDLINRRVY